MGEAVVAPEPFGAPLRLGSRVLRLAGPGDMEALIALRARAFRGSRTQGDTDAHDSRALHLHLSDADDAARPLATARLTLHANGASMLGGYTGQVYELSALAALAGMTLELGRLCVEPDCVSADERGAMVRLLWLGVARVALRLGAARMIGCSSFRGTAPPSADALSLLAARHLGPAALRPGRKAPETLPLVPALRDSGLPEGAALHALPALLRFYLALGGWVGDHLVVDRDLDTCHIFTCVEMDAIPPARRHRMSQQALA